MIQPDLTSFLKRLNFEAQQKQRLSMPTRVESHVKGNYNRVFVPIAGKYVKET